jgi:RNA polymerase sigma-70 factor (ECF subfamily)
LRKAFAVFPLFVDILIFSLRNRVAAAILAGNRLPNNDSLVPSRRKPMFSASVDIDRFLPAARDGCSEALGQILQAYRPYLLAIAAEAMDQGLQAKDGASDVVQETFLEAVRDFSRFHGVSGEQLRAWLRCLLVHRLSKRGRRFRKSRKRLIDRECRLQRLLSDDAEEFPLFALDPTPSENVVDQEQMDRLRLAIEQLPQDYRRVVQLRYQEGLTFEEVGERMGRTATAARLLWRRALERIKHDLGVEANG